MDHFRTSLKIFLNRGDVKAALRLVVNEIVQSMEVEGDENKGKNLVDFLSVIVRDFSELKLPVNPLHKLECLVENLLLHDLAEDALVLTSAKYPSSLYIPVLELKLKIYFNEKNMDDFSDSIVGTSLLNSNVEKSIEYFNKGIDLARKFSQRTLLEKLERQLAEAEKTQQEISERNASQLLEEEENDKIVAEAAKARKQERRRKQKAQKALKKAVETKNEEDGSAETKDEGYGSVETKEEGYGSVETKEEGDGTVETKDEGDGSGSISLVEKKQLCSNFEIMLSVTMESDGDSLMGSIRSNTSEVQKSFIVADEAQINNFQDLVKLCLRHESLLKVDQSFKEKDEYFLITSEDVCTLKCFFKRKISKIAPKSNGEWWNSIQDIFWKIFRGVIRGLMYLFDNNKSCGNLVFNSFVNSEGEGRILPNMATGKQKKDLMQLKDLMQSAVKLVDPSQDDISFLPHHLKSYFNTLTEFHGSCPLKFVLDHPYSWNTTEKISFVFKLRELLKQKPKAAFSQSMKELQAYKSWWLILPRVYKKLYDNAGKRKRSIKRYRDEIDIVRFFGATYIHINEAEYKKDRNNKRFSDEKIESDLTAIFPNFYVDMHWCLCKCYVEKNFTDDDLRDLATVPAFRGK